MGWVSAAADAKWLTHQQDANDDETTVMSDDHVEDDSTADGWQQTEWNKKKLGPQDPDGEGLWYDESRNNRKEIIFELPDDDMVKALETDSDDSDYEEKLRKDETSDDGSPKISEDGVYRHWCKTIVLGGGIAAGYFARTMVEHGLGFDELCILSNDEYYPYERSEILRLILRRNFASSPPGEYTCVHDKKAMCMPDFYPMYGIGFFMHMNVTRVNISENLIEATGLDDGVTRLIKYHQLVIATGSRPLRLEETGVKTFNYSNVYYVYTSSDVHKLREAIKYHIIAHPRRKPRACVIGGGFVGTEAASYTHEWGYMTNLIHSGGHLLNRWLPKSVAYRYDQLYMKSNVTYFKNTRPSGIIGGFNASGIVLDDGTTIKCDIIVAAVGSVPNTDLFKGQLDMTKEGGLVVDSELRTSTHGVYAIGDVAAIPVKFFNGTLRRYPYGDFARRSAEHAATIVTYHPHDKDERPSEFNPFNIQKEFWFMNETNKALDYFPKVTYDSRFGVLKRDQNTDIWIEPLHAEFYGYMVGDPIYFNFPKKRFKFGAFWIHNNKTVGAFIEGGERWELRLMKNAAKMQLPTSSYEYEYMRTRGLTWARETMERVLDEAVYPGYKLNEPKKLIDPRVDDVKDFDSSAVYL